MDKTAPHIRYATLGAVVLLGACAPVVPGMSSEVSETKVPTSTPLPPTETPIPDLGSPQRPIRVSFMGLGDAAGVAAAAEILAQSLTQATGLSIEATTVGLHPAALQEICASSETVMAILPSSGYVLADQLCGVDVAAKAVRAGYVWEAAMFVVPRDSSLTALKELDGLSWVFPDVTSVSRYLYPLYMFKEARITTGIAVASGTDEAAIKAVYNGVADFATATYWPPRVDGRPMEWRAGNPADIPETLLSSCGTTSNEEPYLLCGNYQVRDSRRHLSKELPDVVQKVRILTTTPQIPNEAICFGPEFPADVRATILTALFDFAANDPERFAAAMTPLGWTGFSPAESSEYDLIRLALQASGYGLEDLGE